MNLSRKDTLAVEFQITCLKQYIDYYFAKDINLLKICKFCNKAFLAVNPKAEYDTPQCRIKQMFIKAEQKIKRINLPFYFLIDLRIFL